MKSLIQTRNKPGRKGAMLPMIAVTLIILIIGVVFSIDIAFMHMVRAELRTATDAAARAGAETLARTQDRGEAVQSAIQIAALNSVAGQGLELRPDQVVVGSVNTGANGRLDFSADVEPLNSVRVVGDRGNESNQGPVSLFFGGLLGTEEFQPLQVSTASSSVRDIALVLDISGSMSTREGGLSRIDALRDAVAVFIDEIKLSSPNSTVSLTTYSTTAERVLPLTSDLDSIKLEAQNLNAAGFTNIFQALQFGSDSLVEDPLARDFADKTIVLMTDGRFNRGGNPLRSARVASGRGHSIHTVTFSSGANQRVMMQVAEVGKGVHLHADDGGDLAAAFREIARALSVTLVE